MRMPEGDTSKDDSAEDIHKAEDKLGAEVDAADGSFVTGLSKEEEDRLLKVKTERRSYCFCQMVDRDDSPGMRTNTGYSFGPWCCAGILWRS